MAKKVQKAYFLNMLWYFEDGSEVTVVNCDVADCMCRGVWLMQSWMWLMSGRGSGLSLPSSSLHPSSCVSSTAALVHLRY